MTMIEFCEGGIQVEAQLISDGLGIDLASLQAGMRKGKITSRYERGIDEDVGRHRLTFFIHNRRFRLIVDDTGGVVQRSTIDFSSKPLPASVRRPGS
jgi:hypothetical protein